jgi:WD40 repeat protein
VISTKPAVAEWSPSSDGVYYLEVLGHGKPREVRLGGMYFRQLASRRPAVLMDERALANFGLQLGSWIYGAMSLSPRGSKLAVTAGSAAGRCSVLHVYELRAGRLVKPDKPWLTVRTDEWVMAIDWSPDERAMAAVSAPPLEARARIQVLELASRSWKSVGAVDFAHEEERHAFSVRTLSWSR